jgi:NADH-quinone oxidoreductase subunit N
MPNLIPALPELILAAGILVLILFGAIRGEKSVGPMSAGALTLILVAMAAVISAPEGRVVTFNGSFVVDGFTRFMKVLALAGSAGVLLLSIDYMRREAIERFEYPILILLSTLGMIMMISANDLIALYLGLELQSLAAYVIASFHRDNAKSTEAGLKYFVLGALSSGMLLYGASLIYGFTGTVNFEAIAAALKGEPGIGAILGLVFIAAGLAFKMSAVPFHMWTPDVYEGAPTPVTAFFASAPKMAAAALAVRVFMGAFPGIVAQWQQIIIFIAIASMALGAFAAIGQTNLKRLLAYSSINNIGFALIGLAVGTQAGIQGLILYMTIYLVMTLGAFACLLALRRKGMMAERIEDLSGLARSHPGLAFALAAMMFSLAGIPPLAGFFAKFYVFMAAVDADLAWLAVAGAILSVIGAYYYLNLVKIMYFDSPVEAFEPMPWRIKTIITVSSAFIMLFWIVPAPLVSAAQKAAKTFF